MMTGRALLPGRRRCLTFTEGPRPQRLVEPRRQLAADQPCRNRDDSKESSERAHAGDARDARVPAPEPDLRTLCVAPRSEARSRTTCARREPGSALSQSLEGQPIDQSVRLVARSPLVHDLDQALRGHRLQLGRHIAKRFGGAHALVVVTEWKEFRGADLETIRDQLAEPLATKGRSTSSDRSGPRIGRSQTGHAGVN